MNKCLLALLIALGLSSCAKKNEYYYQLHPKELQEAILACPEHEPQSMSCSQLQAVADRMNSLGYQLQQNPQEFGAKIIALQETIEQQKAQLKKQGTDNNLRADLEKNNQELAEYLAVVKWLESPVS